jgi:hypothetical protein
VKGVENEKTTGEVVFMLRGNIQSRGVFKKEEEEEKV